MSFCWNNHHCSNAAPTPNMPSAMAVQSLLLLLLIVEHIALASPQALLSSYRSACLLWRRELPNLPQLPSHRVSTTKPSPQPSPEPSQPSQPWSPSSSKALGRVFDVTGLDISIVRLNTSSSSRTLPWHFGFLMLAALVVPDEARDRLAVVVGVRNVDLNPVLAAFSGSAAGDKVDHLQLAQKKVRLALAWRVVAGYLRSVRFWRLGRAGSLHLQQVSEELLRCINAVERV